MKAERIKKYKKEDKIPAKEDQVQIMTPNLPPEVMEDILSRVPVKSLMRFRCVSKKWQTLLTNDSTFIQKHLSRTLENDENQHGFILQAKRCYRNFFKYFFLPNGSFKNSLYHEVSSFIDRGLHMMGSFYHSLYHETAASIDCGLHMVGSSNGLICLSHGHDVSVISLWNPATRQHKRLPPSRLHQKFVRVPCIVPLGFGFHHTINDYKVVRIIQPLDQALESNKAEVYSLSTNSWKELSVFPDIVISFWSGTIINGSIHWVASHPNEAHHVLSGFIVSFDMAEEVFRKIPLPDNIEESNVYQYHLRVLNGCLSVIVMIGSRKMEVWVMEEYGVKESWIKLFTAECESSIGLPIEFLKNGELLLHIHNPMMLLSYNPASKELRKLNIMGEGGDDIGAVAAMRYIESLVPVEAGHNVVQGPNQQMVNRLLK